MNDKSNKHEWISLLPFEQTKIKLSFDPITTLTWFHASVDISKLRERVAGIILKNPWLAGTLKKDRNGLWGLEYSNIPNLDAAKKILEERGILREFLMKPGRAKIDPSSQSWIAQNQIIMAAYPELLLKKNDEFGPAPRLMKISLLASADGKFVGYAFSMSHCIGDGHTFYKLYESLLSDKESSLLQLRVHRYMSTTAEQERVFGKQEAHVIISLAAILLIVFNRVCDCLLSWLWPNQFSIVSKTYVIDQDKISKLKKQTKLPFVSTNDILTSWFLSKGSFGVMVINLRGRLPDHNDDMAGNYEALVYYRPTDAATPDLIRQSLKECKRVVTQNQPVTAFAMLCKWNTHLITNWASLYPKSVDKLGVYKTYSHGPVGGITSVFPSHMMLGILYQSSPTQISIIISASPNAHKTIDTSIVAIDDVNENIKTKDL